MLRFLKKSKNRVCVIGLDGVPHSLVKTFIQDGTMPAMAQLANEGHLHRMKVSLPEISAVSWTTFMTGADAGKHGIFGFMDLKPGTLDVRFPNFRDVKVPTLWDKLGKKGKTSIVLNQPSTYPARPIPGVLVSGFVALDLRKAVHPAKLFVDLKRMNYELDIDTQRARVDSDFLLRALDSSLEGRRKLVNLVWDSEDWDYFQVVITGTDRLQHYLWYAIEDTGHRHHQAVRDYYRKVDDFIGEMVERYRKKVGGDNALENLLLLSDHGFTGIKREFNLNTWLQQEGYLSFTGDGAPVLGKMTPDSRAFVLDPSRIYFKRKDRFPDGCVESGDVDALSEEMTRKLIELRHEGEPVVRQVFRGSEIYHGAEASLGPDLLVLTHFGYDAKGALGKSEVLSSTDLQGMHTWDDAFLWAKENLGTELNIVDLASRIEQMLT